MLTRSVGDEGVILHGKLVNIPDTDCIRVTGPAINKIPKSLTQIFSDSCNVTKKRTGFSDL